MNSIWGQLAIGASGSILAAFIIFVLARTNRVVWLLGRSQVIALKMRREGITAFQFRRSEYRERLHDFLAKARFSIEIVAISFPVATQDGDTIELFKSFLLADKSRQVTITVLDPSSSALGMVANSLNMTSASLENEILELLGRLKSLATELPVPYRARLRILLHDQFPMGSAILLDATPHSGIIQVETKLYESPRADSFGFEITAPSEFYSRNYRAWNRVIEESVSPHRAN